MYATNLSMLELLVGGYYAALGVHGIIEPVPSMNHHFLSWLSYSRCYSTELGWGEAIGRKHKDFESKLEIFFQLVDEYRKLVPVLVRSAHLNETHQPTGKRVIIGFGGRMERPERVDIVQYDPEPLHFIRFHYLDGVADDHILRTADRSYSTTILDAENWLSDELQVGPDDWCR